MKAVAVVIDRDDDGKRGLSAGRHLLEGDKVSSMGKRRALPRLMVFTVPTPIGTHEIREKGCNTLSWRS